MINKGGAMVDWVEWLGYDAESCKVVSSVVRLRVQDWALSCDNWKTLSTQQ